MWSKGKTMLIKITLLIIAINLGVLLILSINPRKMLMVEKRGDLFLTYEQRKGGKVKLTTYAEDNSIICERYYNTLEEAKNAPL